MQKFSTQKPLANKLIFISSIIILIFLILYSLSLGTVDISFSQTLNIIFNRTQGIDRSKVYIIQNLRIPRLLTALFTGIALAVAGVTFQAIFQNPMADPYILGISSGSACGVALGLITGIIAIIPSIWGIPLFSFLGAIATSYFIYEISGRMKTGTLTLLLSGLAINLLLSSLMSLMLYFNRNKLEEIIYWQMGSFAVGGYQKLLVIAPLIILCTILIFKHYKELDLVLLGYESASTIGLDFKKETIVLLILSTLLASLAVALSGIIGFIGLIVPHVIRIIFGPSHKKLLPYSLLFGAIFAIIADTFARSIIENTELPISIITALLGSPFFIYLLRKQRRNFEL